MRIKKTLTFLLTLLLVVAMLASCTPAAPKAEAPKDEPKAEAPKEEVKDEAPAVKKVAVFYYQYNDTYISTVRSAFNEIGKADEAVEVLEFDGQGDQSKQNDQVDTAITKGVDVLLVNIVDTGAALTIIEKAKAADLPVIFWNREPNDPSVYATYDKSRFVGTKIEEAGVLQGELIVEFWNEGNHDRNGNGKLDYVLLHGGLDNAEANARSEYAVKALNDAGIEVNEIAMQIANWDNEKAKQAMDAWLGKDKDNIDVVIANNDGMAIGALNSLKAAGLNTDKADAPNYIGVFGVDATEEAKQAMAEGTLSGTVKQDNVAMAQSMFSLAKNAVEGKEFIEGTDYKYDETGIAVRIPYKAYVVGE